MDICVISVEELRNGTKEFVKKYDKSGHYEKAREVIYFLYCKILLGSRKGRLCFKCIDVRT